MPHHRSIAIHNVTHLLPNKRCVTKQIAAAKQETNYKLVLMLFDS